MHCVARLEAAAESEAHEGWKGIAIPSAQRPAAAKELAFDSRITSRIAGDDRAIEVAGPFPDQAVEIAHTVKIGSTGSRKWQRVRCRGSIPSSNGLLKRPILRSIHFGE